jgi:hypothetical protein
LFCAQRRFMVVENAIAGKQPVAAAVVAHQVIARRLCDAVEALRMNRGRLVLRDLCGVPENKRRRGVEEARTRSMTPRALQKIEQAQLLTRYLFGLKSKLFAAVSYMSRSTNAAYPKSRSKRLAKRKGTEQRLPLNQTPRYLRR